MKFMLILISSILLLQLCASEDAQENKRLLQAADDATTPSTLPDTTQTPELEQHRWMGNDTTGRICVMLDAIIRLNFTRQAPFTNLSYVFAVPADAEVNSYNCSDANSIQRLDLTFSKFEFKWTLEFEFSKDNDQRSLRNITVNVEGGPAETYSGDVSLSLSAPKGDSFKCNARQDYTVMGNDQSWIFTNVSTLSMEKLQWQAFMDTATPSFGSPHICTADMTTNDLVPIIVGACLAALVVIVLIAYLVGRARVQRSTGYESV